MSQKAAGRAAGRDRQGAASAKANGAKTPSGAFAVILTWPDIKNAEYEVVQRLQIASKSLGKTCYVLDNEGVILGGPKAGQLIHKDDVEFVISLHFDSPKKFDVFTYNALWNPAKFYFDWGYEKSSTVLLSHDAWISCGGIGADAQLLRFLGSSRRAPQQELSVLNHTLAGPIHQPRRLEKPELFYCGINWERINNAKGRFHDLLLQLDATSFMSIYGPEVFQGVRPWEGYRSYRGSIPFDGCSTVDRIVEAGVALVLSSPAHQQSGIASCRLFESLAAGAVVIANENEFIRREFGDCVLFVSDIHDDIAFEQVASHMARIKSDPDWARDMAVRAQRKFCESYLLDKQLELLFQQHPAVLSSARSQVLARRSEPVDVLAAVLRNTMAEVRSVVENVGRQSYQNAHLWLVVDRNFYRDNAGEIDALLRALPGGGSVVEETLFEVIDDWRISPRRIMQTGRIFSRLRAQLRGGYVAFMGFGEEWFTDHLSALVRVLDDNDEVHAAYSGVVLEGLGGNGTKVRRIDQIIRPDVSPWIYANHHRFGGSFLFRCGLFERHDDWVWEGLDSQEHVLGALDAFMRGEILPTELVTMVHREQDDARYQECIVPIYQQHQFVRDRFAFDRRYRALLAEVSRPRGLANMLETGAPLQPTTIRFPMGTASRYEIGASVRFGKAGNAAPYQITGWSNPEDGHTWTLGRAASLLLGLEDVETDLVLEAVVASLGGNNPEQRISFFVNNTFVGVHNFLPDRIAFLRAPVPKTLVQKNGANLITFVVEDVVRPQELDSSSTDTRALGVCFFHLRLERSRPGTPDNFSSAEFDDATYLKENPDVRSAVERGEIQNAFRHWVDYGVAEGRRAAWIA